MDSGVASRGQLPVARERGPIWLAGLLLVGGELLGLIVGAFHAGGAKPNNHAAAFKQYAESDAWTAVHIGLFVSALIIVAGLVVLARALGHNERGRNLAVLIAVGAAVSAAAAGLVLAIDGVALKQTVDAWVNAVPAEKALAFHDAEVARWMEWGANSFQATAEGVTYLLLGWAILRTAIAPKWIGWLSAVAGLGYIATAFVVGYEGFTDTLSSISVTAGVLFVIVSIGIAVTGWRAKDPDTAAVDQVA
jgi:rhodanese-related sulfurtransferase